jgi:hypothetical protein
MRCTGTEDHEEQNMKHLAMLLALGSVTAFAGAQTAKTHKLTGWIGESKCGATMHTPACVKKCVSAGAKPVFIDTKKQVWAINNTDAVSDYYGEKVHVVATVDSGDHSIHVDKVKKASGM